MSDIEVGRLALRTFRVSNPQDHATGSKPFLNMFGTSYSYPPDMGKGIDAQMTSLMINGLLWPDGACSAVCASFLAPLLLGLDGAPHIPPCQGCHCGVYGTLSLQHLRDQYQGFADKCVAVIAAEGNTMLGDRGLRTQHARVIAYWCIDDYAPVCQRQFKDAKQFSDVLEMIGVYGIPEYPGEEKKEKKTTPAYYWSVSAQIRQNDALKKLLLEKYLGKKKQ